MAQAQIQQQQQKGNQSADFGPDSGGRIKGLTIVKPLIYGNVARYLGKKREEDGHTHEWTVYVKPYNNEDMSNYVKQVTIYHILKLFQSPPGTTPAAVTGDFKKPLVSEFYEELIFQDPSAMMHQLLTNTRQLTLGEYKHDTDFEDKKEKTIKNLLNAKEKISNEIADLREKIKLAKDTITKFKDEISKYQGDMSVDVSGLS